jgi:hypothetical protein
MGALKGAARGLIVPPICGAVIGCLFGMPTMDLPARGLNGLIWGAMLFAIVFSIPGALVGAIVGAVVAASRSRRD